MNKKLSAAAINALKEALVAIYWFKSDMRSFLYNCISNKQTLAVINWGNYKRQIANDIVDALAEGAQAYIDDLLTLCHEVCNMTSFEHLRHLSDGSQKAKKAEVAIEHLKALFSVHQDIILHHHKAEESRQSAAKRLLNRNIFRKKLLEIKVRYEDFVTSSHKQKRGFELEKIMRDLFELFDLDPKASFRVVGEQLDGAFNFEGTDFLFEGKWESDPVGANDLDIFAGKIKRKLENTLGLFLSMSGFSSDGLFAHSKGELVVILMDGGDLIAVFEERIDLVNLIRRKKSHAARTGEIYLPIHKMLNN
jgi:hypothetical protein